MIDNINVNALISKLIVVIVVIALFYLLNKYFNNSLENFDDATMTPDKITYTKLGETYIEPSKKSLDILYTNYSGEEVGKDVWVGKTLDQCTETCNKMEKCVGFSRDAILDSEPGNCYPRSEVAECHSNRKGDSAQMQNAIKFNSYFKSGAANIKNLCIGDMDITLNRKIYIKSYAMPTKYIGNMSGDNRAVLINKNDKDFKRFCGFRIETGKDGVGTVSFVHIDTNKNLYRDENGQLIVKDISAGKTIDKQRSSFNLFDGLSQSIMLHPMTFDGETTKKFVITEGNYLQVIDLDTVINKSDSAEPEKLRQRAMFYIVDTIVESAIVSGKANEEKTVEGFEVKLDKSDEYSTYYNLFKTPSYVNIDDYLNDNYNKGLKATLMNTDIDKKMNDIQLKKEMSKSIAKGEEEYNSMNDLNMEIEKQIYMLSNQINNRNDMIVNRMDKMKLTDMANDYFFLKFMTK